MGIEKAVQQTVERLQRIPITGRLAGRLITRFGEIVYLPLRDKRDELAKEQDELASVVELAIDSVHDVPDIVDRIKPGQPSPTGEVILKIVNATARVDAQPTPSKRSPSLLR